MIEFPIIVPNFNPNIIEFGSIAIRWYSLAYIIGILFTWFFLKNCNEKQSILSKEALDDWLFWGILGIIIGGRLGYVLFYNLSYYASNFWQIFAVWQGGMSFHGGLFGAIFSMFLFSRKYKINFWQLTDILSISAPIGLFFGRIANFINLELYGRVTESNYGFIFPNAGPYPRHPSQLYEAILEGLLAFVVLFSLSKYTKIRNKSGIISGIFLIIYGFARIFVEQFREPDMQIGFLLGGNITMGQILSAPLIAIGFLVIYKRSKANI